MYYKNSKGKKGKIMSINKKYTTKRSLTGVVLASLFALSTTMSTYATEVGGSQQTSSGTISPFINVIDQRTPNELTIKFSNDDVIAAGKVAESTAVTAEQYILAAEYQACVLSNTMEADSSKAGILMKVTKGTSSNFYATSNTNSQTQLALYSTATSGGANKIRFILHVMPAGETKLGTTFGAAGSASGSYNQFDAAAFVIGASVSGGSTATVYLNDANASSASSSAVSLENLALDTWGTVNHFAMNPNLGAEGSGAVLTTSDETATTGGIVSTGGTLEGLHIDGCSADQDPSSTDTLVTDAGLLTIKIYVNANDMAKSVAGTYSTEYKLSFADVDDISSGVDDTQ